jgi:tetratricopeptide (TPR) repeat protein
MRRILIGLALAALALPAWAQSNTDKCATDTDPDAGIRDCTAAIQSGRETTADLAGDYSNRAVFYERKSLYQQAISDKNKSISLDPNDAVPYVGLGNIYNEVGQYDLAVENESKAISLNPSSEDLMAAYLDRGNAYINKNRFDQAIADYDKAISINQNVAILYHNRALAYLSKSLYDQVITDETKAIALQPDFILAYSSRGMAYERKGLHDQAIADYRAALKLDPTDDDAKKGLARLGVAP